MSNASVLNNSVNVFEQIKRRHIMAGIQQVAYDWLQDALHMRKGWEGFTGNLPTSYAVGIWDFDGTLVDILFAERVDQSYSIGSIIGRKVNKGEVAHLTNPWEGEERTVRGEVDIAEPFGPALSEAYLRAYQPSSYPSICICTGAEYSQFLESRPGANVLYESGEPTFVRRLVEGTFTNGKFNLKNFTN